MKKTVKNFGEVKYIKAEEWINLNWNPYRFNEGYYRTEDGEIVEIYSCGNASKKYNIPKYISVEA